MSVDQLSADVRPAISPSNSLDGERSGKLLTAIGVVGIVLSIIVGVLGWRLIGDLGATAEQSLTLSGEALITIDRTIKVVGDTVGTLSAGMGTVEGSLYDASTTLENAGALFAVTAEIAETDLPASIASLRQALPPVISSAESITDAIGALSLFGINTGPTTPLAEPIREIEANLIQLEDRLRAQASAISDISRDFDEFAGDASTLADNVGQMNRDLAEAESLLIDYETTTANAREAIEQTRSDVARTVSTSRATLIILAILFGLSQATPILVGRFVRNAELAADTIAPRETVGPAD